MTLEEALALQKGDYVVTPRTRIPREPVRVTDVWVNDSRTIVMFRAARIDASAWIHATGFELPPKGQVWNKELLRWVPKAPGKAA